MSVTRAEVMHVAQLARLELSPDEVERFTEQLNSILAHVSQLGTEDLAKVHTIDTATDWPAPLRRDEPGADALAFPPEQLSHDWEAGFFTVPRLHAMSDE